MHTYIHTYIHTYTHTHTHTHTQKIYIEHFVVKVLSTAHNTEG